MDANEYEKLSKKKKRDLYPGKRTVWAFSPVTRRPENPKVYNRRKAQKRMDDAGSVLSFCLAVFERGHTQSLDLVREQSISSNSIMFVILDKARSLSIIINIKR